MREHPGSPVREVRRREDVRAEGSREADAESNQFLQTPARWMGATINCRQIVAHIDQIPELDTTAHGVAWAPLETTS
jgi:hypothetical protein